MSFVACWPFMHTHIRAVAVLQIVYGSLGMLLAFLVGALFGGIATLVGFNAPPAESVVAVPILAAIGAVGASIISALSLPRLIAGIGLLYFKQWARIVTIVVSVLGLPDFPVGTTLGAYSLWVLVNREGAALFEAGSVRPA
jgi:hypothetical protein